MGHPDLAKGIGEWSKSEDTYWQEHTIEGKMWMMEQAQAAGVLDQERKERAKRAMAYLVEVDNG